MTGGGLRHTPAGSIAPSIPLPQNITDIHPDGWCQLSSLNQPAPISFLMDRLFTMSGDEIELDDEADVTRVLSGSGRSGGLKL